RAARYEGRTGCTEGPRGGLQVTVIPPRTCRAAVSTSSVRSVGSCCTGCWILRGRGGGHKVREWDFPDFPVAEGLRRTCARDPSRMEWLGKLPELVHELAERWQLTPGPLLGEEDTTCSYVAAVTCADGTPAVLKVAMPHMEGEHEIAALRFWD